MARTHLQIADMAARHIGLTQPIAETFFEAASVCLARHHTPPAQFSVQDGNNPLQVLVNWKQVDERMRNAWANDIDATRDGAYACALAAVELTTNMVAIRRAETLTGSDYYIGQTEQTTHDLEGLLRLEVSGVDQGEHSAVRRRLKEKIAQAARGKSNLPAIACVVGFKVGMIAIGSVDQT